VTKLREFSIGIFFLRRKDISMRQLLCIGLLLSCLARAGEFSFRDRDTVVLLGNTFVERAQQFGYLETELALAAGVTEVRFRNLGWSGDTVYGTARSYFGPPKEGFARLKNDLTGIKPTVVMVCYGAVASFEGEKKKDDFIEGYGLLLDMIEGATGAREIILLSPPPAETLPGPMPKMAAQNGRLKIYRNAIRKLASKRGLRFADLFKAMKGSSEGLTENGLHFGEKGYAAVAPKLVEAMGLKPVSLNSEQRDALREKIIGKNKLFFQQWRPSNETYLRLFRKHEQGQNVKELEEFDAIIASREAEIMELKGRVMEVAQ
jgi:lysophospholipase L1-like esterase